MKLLKKEFIVTLFMLVVGHAALYGFVMTYTDPGPIIKILLPFEMNFFRFFLMTIVFIAGMSLGFYLFGKDSDVYYKCKMLERYTEKLDNFTVERYKNNVLLSVFNYENGPFRDPEDCYVWCPKYDMGKMMRLRSLLVEYRYNYRGKLISVTPFPHSRKNTWGD